MKNPVSFKRNIKIGKLFDACHKPVLIPVRDVNPDAPHLRLVAFRYIQSTANPNGLYLEWNKYEYPFEHKSCN